MSKNKIRIIISLMALASISLIAFQIYWIGYINRSNNEVFGANVREAMQEVVRKLEKKELIYITQKKTLEDTKRKELLAISSKRPIKKTNPKKRNKSAENKTYANQSFDKLQPNAITDILNFEPFQLIGNNLPINEINIQFDVQNPNIEDIETIYKFNEYVNEQMQAYQLAFSDSLNNFRNAEKVVPTKNKKAKKQNLAKKEKKASSPADLKVNDKMSKLSQKSEIMKDVFGDYLLKERPISERINKTGLDSLLQTEMLLRGYDIPMQYGISLSEDSSRLHYLSSPSLNLEAQKTIKNEGFAANLFPNDMFNSQNKLFVYFPSRKSFLLKNIWMNILGSLAMITIVFTCFYIAVNTILKQKKLADIKNDFINNMTHEFKTPISTISLACEVLNDKAIGQNTTILHRYLGIINDENKRLGTQVEKVLQTALLDKGEVKMKFTKLNLHTIIENVISNISPQIELKSGEIMLDLQANNPEVEADAVHITNVIFNLLDNAIKYSAEKPAILVKSENTQEGIKFTIADNGIGMESDQLKNIFEKFYRVPTGNLHDVKGFGLGLSYVKKMVEEHHGNISVKSEINKGSIFEVFLPEKQLEPI